MRWDNGELFNKSFKKNTMAKPVELKTKPTEFSVEDYIESLANEQQRKDSRAIINLMKKATKHEPQMWGKINDWLWKRAF